MSEHPPSDDIKPWSIRGVVPEARNAALAAATRDNTVIGEWIALAIRAKIKADRSAQRGLTVTGTPRAAIEPGADLDTTDRLIGMARQIAQDTRKPIPRSLVRLVHAVIRDRLCAARDRSLTMLPARQTDAHSGEG